MTNREVIERIKARTKIFKRSFDPYQEYKDYKGNVIIDLLFIVEYLLQELDKP